MKDDDEDGEGQVQSDMMMEELNLERQVLT